MSIVVDRQPKVGVVLSQNFNQSRRDHDAHAGLLRNDSLEHVLQAGEKRFRHAILTKSRGLHANMRPGGHDGFFAVVKSLSAFGGSNDRIDYVDLANAQRW